MDYIIKHSFIVKLSYFIMKKTKLIFTAALVLGLLFCVSDATAQQATKKVKTQKPVQTQNNQQIKRAEILKAKSGKTVIPAGYIIKSTGHRGVQLTQPIIRPRRD